MIKAVIQNQQGIFQWTIISNGEALAIDKLDLGLQDCAFFISLIQLPDRFNPFLDTLALINIFGITRL